VLTAIAVYRWFSLAVSAFATLPSHRLVVVDHCGPRLLRMRGCEQTGTGSCCSAPAGATGLGFRVYGGRSSSFLLIATGASPRPP